MTLEEALVDIERLSGGLARPPLAQQETSCRDTQQAVRLLPRPTNIFASATICTPTGADPPLWRRRPRVCRQTDASGPALPV